MGPKIDPVIEARILELYNTKQYSYRKMQKKLLEEEMQISATSILHVCKSVGKRRLAAAKGLAPHKNKYTPKKATPEVIQKVAELTSVGSSLTQSAIAKLVGVSSRTVRRIIHEVLGNKTTTENPGNEDKTDDLSNNTLSDHFDENSSTHFDEDFVTVEYSEDSQGSKSNLQIRNQFCIICTESESFTNELQSTDEVVSSNFESEIKSFCELFSLPPDYFQGELKVSITTLQKNVCYDCQKKIELISSVVSEIDRLKNELDALKTSVKKDLTRITSMGQGDDLEVKNSDSEFSNLRIREQLQQRILSALQSTSENSQTQENIVIHADATSFFANSEPGSPASNSNSCDHNESLLSIDEIKNEENVSEFPENQTENPKSDQFKPPPLRRRSRSTVTAMDPRVKDCSVILTPLSTEAIGNKSKQKGKLDKKKPKKYKICEHCNESVKTATFLIHKSTFHGSLFPHVCQTCNRGFNQKVSLERHEKYYAEKTDYFCNSCSAGFHFKTELEKHERSNHAKAGVLTCEFCGEFSKNSEEFMTHKHKAHGTPYPHLCGVCNKSFIYQHKLKAHSTIHTNERPFLCQECGFTTRLKENLAAHMRIHERRRKTPPPENVDEPCSATITVPVPVLVAIATTAEQHSDADEQPVYSLWNLF